MYDYKKSMMPYDDSIEIDVKNIIEKLIFTVSKYWLPMVLSIIIICELAVSYSAFTYEPEYAAYVTYAGYLSKQLDAMQLCFYLLGQKNIFESITKNLL